MVWLLFFLDLNNFLSFKRLCLVSICSFFAFKSHYVSKVFIYCILAARHTQIAVFLSWVYRMNRFNNVVWRVIVNWHRIFESILNREKQLFKILVTGRILEIWIYVDWWLLCNGVKTDDVILCVSKRFHYETRFLIANGNLTLRRFFSLRQYYFFIENLYNAFFHLALRGV